ncbi:MAG: hypothetical protein ABW095_11795 [Candidatus Thiodiazotropha sp.]
MNTLADSPQPNTNLLQLWILILLFALPSTTAWLFFYHPEWLPEGRTNHGTLISPPRSLESLPLTSAAGSRFEWNELQDQWTLALVREGGCDPRCVESLIEMRQIRRATGANRERIERLLILVPDTQGRLEIPPLDGLEGTQLAIADSAQRGNLLALFPSALDRERPPLFLIDPRINLMMSHDTTGIPAKQILQDLEKLLKVSQSWVKGGQYGHQ